MTRRDLHLLALDYCAGVLDATVGCDYPSEVYEREEDIAKFEDEIQAVSAALSRRAKGFRGRRAATVSTGDD